MPIDFDLERYLKGSRKVRTSAILISLQARQYPLTPDGDPLPSLHDGSRGPYDRLLERHPFHLCRPRPRSHGISSVTGL